MGQNNSTVKKKGSTEIVPPLMKIHKARRNKVIGCMKCAKEIKPDASDENTPHKKRDGWGFLCGTYCMDEFIGKSEESTHVLVHNRREVFLHPKEKNKTRSHILFKEPVDLHVDVSRIKEMCENKSQFSAAETLRDCFDTYKRRWLLGERKNAFANEFEWWTYEKVLEEVKFAFKACTDLFGLKSNVPGDDSFDPQDDKDPSFCVLIGASSRVWYLVYFMCMLHGIPLVPMDSSQTVKQIQYVIEKTNPLVVFISKFKDMPKTSGDVNIVSLEDSELRYLSLQKQHTRKDEEGGNSTTWTDLVKRGKNIESHEEKKAKPLKKEEEYNYNPDAIRLLLSSSGTTGLPKLIIKTDEMMRNKCFPPKQGRTTAMLSIQPLRQCLDVCAKGGRIGVYTSIAHLDEDIGIVRPTVFGSTPAFFLAYYERYKSELREALEVKAKAEEEENGTKKLSGVEIEKVKKKVQAEWVDRGVLGNRCKIVIVGGAVSSKELREFIFDNLSAIVVDGYGTTETGAVSSSGRILKNVKLLLIDAPQYGYLTSDSPYPRGEIVVHTGKRMTRGYFNDEEATKKQFLEIGGVTYSRTGDIGVMRNGEIEVIDRIKSLFKLRTGIWVSPSNVESVFENSSYVQNVFVWGCSSMAFLACAVVVVVGAPDSEVNVIRQDFSRLAQENELSGQYVPKWIVLESEQWSVDNGLMNGAGKKIRSQLTKKYKAKFLQLSQCKEEEVEEPAELASSSAPDDGSGLMSGLVKIIRETLPNFDVSILPGKKFEGSTKLFDLGMNSLEFARLVGSIRETFNSSLTLPRLFKCETLADVQNFAVFGVEMKKERLQRDEQFWEGEVKSGVRLLKKVCENDSKKWTFEDVAEMESDSSFTVLLTGARGFVGSHLLAELCKRGVRVICVLRKSCTASSLDLSLSSVLEKFELSKVATKGHWQTIPGDISQPDFGITFEFLSTALKNLYNSRIEIVIHCAASVGSARPYESLKPANVFGTVHACALAKKLGSRLVHISTVGFLPGGLPDACEANVPSSGLSHLGSYAQSKYVAERIVLLHDQEVGNVSVARVGTCFGSRKIGAANVNDSVIKLIAGLVKEGCYCVGAGSPLPRMFRLCPVDYVAEKIVDEHVQPILSKKDQVRRITTAMTLNETKLVDIVKALEKSVGIKLKEVTPDSFRSRMEELATAGKRKGSSSESIDHPLYVYASTLASSGFASDVGNSEEEKPKSELKGSDTHPAAADIEATLTWMKKNGIFEEIM